ncbi:L,D-transpeptidase family protein [Aestuariivita boseongensis]|uniref:L,D-transpeptidase family protein n=1 Tax=Aestuariivita boseongensis TaxID=1470562 RepID=UPI000681E133|nr:L,D-transpeptidase family protein [Aestuariivita boseongensis]
MIATLFKRSRVFALTAALALAAPAFAPTPAFAQVTAFKQAVAEAAARDADVAAFYRGSGFDPIWTGGDADDLARRKALMRALEAAETHGLPTARYDRDGLMQKMRAARSTRDLGFLEVELTQAFLQYARDIQTGAVIPSRIDPGIVREIPYRDRSSYLASLARADDPDAFMATLVPATTEYRALLKHKLMLEQLIANGGWGPKVRAKALEPGDQGPEVVALRDRLIAMGYMQRNVKSVYDKDMQKAVQLFQARHGLEEDGVAGEGTLAEINVDPQARLRAVTVALERERWLNRDRGERHILVNLADFHARIIDDGHETFRTRSVIGKNVSDRRSPEFSDVMEHMVVNPSWFVPRSIATKEYLPKLKANPNAVRHLVITDARGQRIDRGAVDFSRYSTRNFPFDMRQPPGNSNALGLVKFMFPNKYNIYLHDTPQKHLFARESRAYSHGCIRLADPFDFAYALLARQEDDPKAYFQSVLRTGAETKVNLEQPVPVHLIYRTAQTDEKGQIEYRRDVYERDAKIWQALSDAGVVLRGVQG